MYITEWKSLRVTRPGAGEAQRAVARTGGRVEAESGSEAWRGLERATAPSTAGSGGNGTSE